MHGPDRREPVTPAYGFCKPLDIRLLPDGRWELREELRYLSALTQKAYTIEKGFVTDFASVPRIPVAYWLTGNTAHLAATVHDYLYQHGLEPRSVADDIFAEIMDGTRVPGWRKAMMWMGVRLFGAEHYKGEQGEAKAGFDMSQD